MASLLRLRLPARNHNPTPSKPTVTPATKSPATEQLEPEPTRGPTLMDLPPELHLQIAEYLMYPDALSLKHVNCHFNSLVYTGVKLKVEWLLERRALHLDCPNHHRCDLGSDLRFCRGSVALLMKRRRDHIECESRAGLGCIVHGTPTCPQKRTLKSRIARRLRRTFAVEQWWVLLAAVPMVMCAIWIAEVLRADQEGAEVGTMNGLS